MSPEIYINDELIVSVPDKSGVYSTEVGQIKIDSSLILPGSKRFQDRITIDWNHMPGKSTRRIVEISKKRGSGSQPLDRNFNLEVRLHGTPEARDYRPGANGRTIGRYYPDYPHHTWGERKSLR